MPASAIRRACAPFVPLTLELCDESGPVTLTLKLAFDIRAIGVWP